MLIIFYIYNYTSMLTPITINYQVFLYCTFFRDFKKRSKAGDEQLVQNYRPISVLLVTSKIYENIVTNYLINFIFGLEEFY